MNRSLALLLASSAAAALIAACSAAPETGGLGGRGHSPSAGPTAGSTGSTGTGTTTGGGNTPPSSSGGTTPTSVPLQPPPAAGPGSTQSQAHQYFDNTVYPQLSVCQGCHSTGNDGAPKMMESPADTTYSELDSLGLIQANSALVTQGSHDNGKAPALSQSQQSVVVTWLGMEAQERQGSAAPPNIMANLASCVDMNLWNQIGWEKLVTQPRTNENPNRCTGCNQAQCNSCHLGGDANFMMAEGTNLEPQGYTFQQTFQSSESSIFMLKYFGLNGATPVASNAIMLKQQAVAAGPAYSHPMFTMDATMTAALNAFVNDALTKYQNKQCGNSSGGSDAGTD
jgi:hypothetical protein